MENWIDSEIIQPPINTIMKASVFSNYKNVLCWAFDKTVCSCSYSKPDLKYSWNTEANKIIQIFKYAI